MKIIGIGIICLLCLFSCDNQSGKAEVHEEPREQEAISSQISILSAEDKDARGISDAPIDLLSLDGLQGKWLLLDGDGNANSSGDYFLVEKKDEEYRSLLVYQGHEIRCILTNEGEEIFATSDQGYHYRIGRSESIINTVRNGIWLILGDIDLGNFQREDVLKELD